MVASRRSLRRRLISTSVFGVRVCKGMFGGVRNSLRLMLSSKLWVHVRWGWGS